jgi:5-formyltetrahydrofolate cyclo-ligase
MDTVELKKNIRKELTKVRKEQSPQAIESNSKRVFSNWKKYFSIKEVAWLHLFQSIESQGEVQTNLFFEFLRTKHARIKLVVPVVDPHLGRLRHAYIPENVEMETNKWGIPEPKCPVEFIPPMMMDMVLVPLLGFDSKGNRIGYGKGYYDQFLPLLRPGCPKIGLAFECQKLNGLLPTESHDVPLDYVITEEKVYRFG